MRIAPYLLVGLGVSGLAAGVGCANAANDAGGGAGGEPGSTASVSATGQGGAASGGATAGPAAGPGATVASSGVGAAGGGLAGCSGGLASCDGDCVDLKTDPQNCGDCGHDCKAHPCIVAVCQEWEVLASGQGEARGIAVDSTSIYWTSEGNGTVMKMPKGGGSAVTLAPAQNIPGAIAVDGTSVYWVNHGDGTVMQLPIGGGTPLQIGSAAGSGIAVDATSVYFPNSADMIVKVPIGGGTPATVASAPDAQKLVVAGPWVYFSSSELDGIKVWRVPTGGGLPVQLGASAGPSFVPAIAVSSTSVYWADGQQLLRVPLEGSGTPEVIDDAFGLWQLAMDGSSVYWGTDGGMHVMKAPLDSVASATIATTFGDPATEIAVDDTWVYWTSYSGGEIVRAPK